jgi:hypothetical protein
MSVGLLLASLALSAQGASAPAPVVTSTRWEWRLCTRNSAAAQLRTRPLSLAFQDVVDKAFEDCAEQLNAVARTQSPDDLRRLREQQTLLIRQDVETFYWDRMTGQI